MKTWEEIMEEAKTVSPQVTRKRIDEFLKAKNMTPEQFTMSEENRERRKRGERARFEGRID